MNLSADCRDQKSHNVVEWVCMESHARYAEFCFGHIQFAVVFGCASRESQQVLVFDKGVSAECMHLESLALKLYLRSWNFTQRVLRYVSYSHRATGLFPLYSQTGILWRERWCFHSPNFFFFSAEYLTKKKSSLNVKVLTSK